MASLRSIQQTFFYACLATTDVAIKKYGRIQKIATVRMLS